MHLTTSYSTYLRRLAALGATGSLNRSDLDALACQRLRVFSLMRDGCWHPGPEIVEIAGGSEGLRRLRELRETPGVEIAVRRPSALTRVFLYRMVYDQDKDWRSPRTPHLRGVDRPDPPATTDRC